MDRAPFVAAVLAAGCGLAAGLRADVVSIPPAKDNTLYQDALGGLSNGAGPYFFAGTTFGELVRRAVIAFDAAGSIPAGATVTSVSLTLHMSRTPSATEIVSLHRTLADWGEGASIAFGEGGGGAPAEPGDATWIHTFHPDQFWASAGGDFDPAASASAAVAGIGFYTWTSTGALIADVQSWLDSPSTNYGWTVVCNEALAGTAKRFDSKEHADPAVRPVLTVEYRCLADYNGDGFVDGIDYDTFNNDFEAGRIEADINGDGFVDGIDYDTFNNHFETGC